MTCEALLRTVAGESEIEYLCKGFFNVEFFCADAKMFLSMFPLLPPFEESEVALNWSVYPF